METMLKIKVDEFLAHKIEDIVKIGAFRNEEDFLKSAVEDSGKVGNSEVERKDG